MTTDTMRDAKVYEIGYLLVSSVPAEKVGEETAFIHALLEKNKATIIAQEDPELRSLAYEMRKKIGSVYHTFDQAYFGWIKFELTPDAIEDVKKVIEARESVLRLLLISTVKEATYLGKKDAPVIVAEDIAGKEAGAEAQAPVAEEVAAPKEA